MDETRLAEIQKKIEDVDAIIIAAENAGKDHDEIWELRKKHAIEQGINYREIVKLRLQDGWLPAR